MLCIASESINFGLGVCLYFIIVKTAGPTGTKKTFKYVYSEKGYIFWDTVYLILSHYTNTIILITH